MGDLQLYANNNSLNSIQSIISDLFFPLSISSKTEENQKLCEIFSVDYELEQVYKICVAWSCICNK